MPVPGPGVGAAWLAGVEAAAKPARPALAAGVAWLAGVEASPKPAKPEKLGADPAGAVAGAAVEPAQEVGVWPCHRCCQLLMCGSSYMLQ